jgi:hypothetical protein
MSSRNSRRAGIAVVSATDMLSPTRLPSLESAKCDTLSRSRIMSVSRWGADPAAGPLPCSRPRPMPSPSRSCIGLRTWLAIEGAVAEVAAGENEPGCSRGNEKMSDEVHAIHLMIKLCLDKLDVPRSCAGKCSQ